MVCSGLYAKRLAIKISQRAIVSLRYLRQRSRLSEECVRSCSAITRRSPFRTGKRIDNLVFDHAYALSGQLIRRSTDSNWPRRIPRVQNTINTVTRSNNAYPRCNVPQTRLDCRVVTVLALLTLERERYVRCFRFNSGVLSFVPIFRRAKRPPNSENGKHAALAHVTFAAIASALVHSRRGARDRAFSPYRSTLVRNNNRLAHCGYRPIERVRHDSNRDRKRR